MVHIDLGYLLTINYNVMKTQLIFAFAICIFLGSCIPTSIHPFYTEETLITADEIVGSWKEEEISLELDVSTITIDGVEYKSEKNNKVTLFEEWNFTKSDKKGNYHLEIISPDQDIIQAYMEHFEADDPSSVKLISDQLSKKKDYKSQTLHLDVHTFKIDKQVYLNFYPDQSEMNGTDGFYEYHLLPVHSFAKLINKDGQMELKFLNRNKFSKLIENQMIKIKHEKTDDHIILTASTRNLQKFIEKYGEDDSLFDKEGKILIPLINH
jgi:hypothetical protein